LDDSFCIVYHRFYKIVFDIIETIPWKPNLFFNISIDPIYFYHLYSAYIYIDDRNIWDYGDLSGISKVFLILFVGVGLPLKKRIERHNLPTYDPSPSFKIPYFKRFRVSCFFLYEKERVGSVETIRGS
jgi:hypothetical protein